MTIIAIILFIIGVSKICLLASESEVKMSSNGLPITEKQGKRIAITLVSIDAIVEIIGGLFILSL